MTLIFVIICSTLYMYIEKKQEMSPLIDKGMEKMEDIKRSIDRESNIEDSKIDCNRFGMAYYKDGVTDSVDYIYIPVYKSSTEVASCKDLNISNMNEVSEENNISIKVK